LLLSQKGKFFEFFKAAETSGPAPHHRPQTAIVAKEQNRSESRSCTTSQAPNTLSNSSICACSGLCLDIHKIFILSHLDFFWKKKKWERFM